MALNDWQKQTLLRGYDVRLPSGAIFDADDISVEVPQRKPASITSFIENAERNGFDDLLDYAEGKVYVRLGGGCQGCGMVDVTLKQGIEALLRQEIPEIVEVVDTTDHASGTNPYYTSGK